MKKVNEIDEQKVKKLNIQLTNSNCLKIFFLFPCLMFKVNFVHDDKKKEIYNIPLDSIR